MERTEQKSSGFVHFRTILGTLFLVMLVAACTEAWSAGESEGDEEGPKIAWITMNEALEQTEATGKKILIDFYTDWCGWCKRMDKTTYADSAVVAYMNENFLSVKLNPEKNGTVSYEGGEYSNREFTSAFRVRGYPATGFMNEKNEVITLVPGAIIEPTEFLTILQYIAEDHYLTSTFDEYRGTN